MTTKIDHIAYPHVIDSIIYHCKHEALLALRGVSRAFRNRADAKLYEHVVITRSSRPNVDIVLTARDDVLLPGNPRFSRNTPCDRITRDATRRMEEYTRYVDLRGGLTAAGVAALEALEFPRLEIVRLISHRGEYFPQVPFPAAKVIVFAPLGREMPQIGDIHGIDYFDRAEHVVFTASEPARNSKTGSSMSDFEPAFTRILSNDRPMRLTFACARGDGTVKHVTDRVEPHLDRCHILSVDCDTMSHLLVPADDMLAPPRECFTEGTAKRGLH